MLARGYLIIIKRDGRDGSVYPVTTPTCSVGRGLHNDIRIHVQSVSQEHCVIYTSDFKQAMVKNLSNVNPTKVNNVSIHENEHHLEHGDVITTGERSFRWEYVPQSQYYVPTKTNNARPISTSPLRGSTEMVGMPVSVLQSALGSQPFNRRSVVGPERKIKLSPVLTASSGRTPSKCGVSLSPSKRLVAIVSPQRRPQSEKKELVNICKPLMMSRAVAANRMPSQQNEGLNTVAAPASSVATQSRKQKTPVAADAVTNVSSPADMSVPEWRNQSSAKTVDSTPSNRKSDRLYSISAKKAAVSHVGVKMFYNKRSWQALVTTRKEPLASVKARKSAGATPVLRASQIPTRVKSVSKLSSTKTSQSAKKSRMSSGNHKMKSPFSSVKKANFEQKGPVAISIQEKHRKLESGLRSAERAAKRLKLESPKTPDKKKMAALLVCHGKVSRPKNTPLIVSKSANTSKVESRKSRTPATASKSGSALHKTARKKSENLQRTSSGVEMTSAAHAFSMEIPSDFSSISEAADLGMSSDQKAKKSKESPLRLSRKSRKSHALRSEQAVLPEAKGTANICDVAELTTSPVKVTSTRKTASMPLPSCGTGHTPAAVTATERTSNIVSEDCHTSDICKLEIGVSSDKKAPKHNVRQSLLKSLMKKSLQSKLASSIENIENSEIPQSLLSTSHVGRKSRSKSLGCPVTSNQTNQTSSQNSRNLSVKQSPKSVSHSPGTTKFSPPELEQKARSVTHSNTSVSEMNIAGRRPRSSRIAMQSQNLVESLSRSPPDSGVEGSQSTHAFRLTTSVRKSRTSVVSQSLNSDESDSRSLLGTEDKGRSFYTDLPVSKRTASAKEFKGSRAVVESPESDGPDSRSAPGRRNKEKSVSPTMLASEQTSSARKSRGTGVVSSFLVSADQNSDSAGLRTSRSLSKRMSSAQKSNYEVDPSSSGSRFPESPCMPESSESHIHRLSRSNTSLNSISPQRRLLLLESVISYDKISSSKKRVSQSPDNQTHLPTPSSQNTTFDFDSVKTPYILLEDLVSPLSSNRKQKRLRWRGVNTSKRKAKSEPASKRQCFSKKVDGNVTFSGGDSVKLLAPQQLFTSSLIDESIDISHIMQKGWGSYNTSFSDGVKTRTSPKNASPYACGLQKLMKISPRFNLSDHGMNHESAKSSRISEMHENDFTNISGLQQLTETPSSPKSHVNDLSDVYEGIKLAKTPRIPKSPKNDINLHIVKQSIKDLSPKLPKNDLRDVCGVKQLMKMPRNRKSSKYDQRVVRGVRRLMKTPKSPKSPKNDLRDVCGVRKLMKTPRSPKSPRNDLRDVRGVRRLMKTPESPKSPKNDLRDVRGVRQLMKTPESPKSPKNDLRDVRGVRQLMKTPRSPKSPKNDLRDVRGVRQLMKTPRSPKSPKNDLRDVRGVRLLMKTPESPKSPKNDLRDVRGVRQLMKTPRSPKSPKNDLRDVRGVRQLMKTPRSPKSPKNDLRDVRGVRQLMKTPRSPKSPKNDLRDVRGVRQLMRTPRSPKSPKNDLRDVRGVRQLMKTPRSPKSPKNDLRDVRGVRRLMKTPKSPKSPKNDLRDVRGVRRLLKTPKSPKSPKNDLTDVFGVKRLLTSPKSMNSPVNDLTDVLGVKELMKTPRSPRSPTNDLTDTKDVHLGKTLTPHSPMFGSHASQTQSKSELPENKFGLEMSIIKGKVPPMAPRTRRCASGKKTPIKHSPQCPESEDPVADKNSTDTCMREEVKMSNARSRRNRKGPNLSTSKTEVADGSLKLLPKKQRQKKEGKDNTENISLGSHVELSATDAYNASGGDRNGVHFNVSDSPTTPVARVMRKKRGVANAEVELPSSLPGIRRMLRSKGNAVETESAEKFENAYDGMNDQPISSPAVRKTRGMKLTNEVEVSSSPARRKRGGEVGADIESCSSLKRKRGTTVTAEVESPLPPKRQQGATTEISVEESSCPRRRQQAAVVTTSSELPSLTKRRQPVTVTVDTELSPPKRRRGAAITTAEPISSRTRRGAAVTTKVESHQSPVTRKMISKSTRRTAGTSPVAIAVPVEDNSFLMNKQPGMVASPPAVKRGKRTKPVEPPSPIPARKLRGTKLDVPEQTESSVIKTRSKKTRVISSPVLKAKSAHAAVRRRGKQLKKEVSPQVTTERQTRASRRKK